MLPIKLFLFATCLSRFVNAADFTVDSYSVFDYKNNIGFLTKNANLQQFDSVLMRNKNIADIERFFETVKLNEKVISKIGPTVMIRAAMHDNLPFFLMMLNRFKVKADAVDSNLGISPLDYLTGLWNPSADQRAMLEAANNKSKDNRVPVSVRTRNSPIMRYVSRFGTIEEYETFFKDKDLICVLDDGSHAISQAIIGDNLEFIKGYFAKWKANINYRWANKKVVPDIVGIYGINPIGWTHLMLAVALNRIEIVKYLVEEHPEGADANLGRGIWNPIELALSLPEALRPPMLSILQKSKSFESANELKCATPEELRISLLAGGSNGFAENYLKTRTNLDLEAIKCFAGCTGASAVRSALAISPESVKKYEIHKYCWDGLMMDKVSTVEDLAAKISIFSLYGFRLDDRRLFGGDKTPWHQIVTMPNHAEYERLTSAVLKCTGLFDINLVEPECDFPVFEAIIGGNYTLTKAMLRHAKANPEHQYVAFNDSGTFDAVKCARNCENLGCPKSDMRFLSHTHDTGNLLHCALRYIGEEVQLVEIINLLKEINAGYMNSVVPLSPVSACYFNVDGLHACYRTDKRSHWTCLMLALFTRKDKASRQLVAQGASKTKTGADGIGPGSIIKMRCDALRRAIYKPEKVQKTLLNEEALKEYVKLMREEFKKLIDEDLNATLDY